MFKKTLIAAALAVAATGSFAQYYVQGALGQGNVSTDCASSAACKKSNSGNKILFGYEAGNGLSYEGQIINYGKMTGNFADVKSSGFGGNVAYSANINDNFSYRLAGGLGVNKVSDPTATTTTTGLTLGAGVAYNFTKTVAATLEYDISSAKLQYPATSYNFSLGLLSFGIRAKF